MKERMAGDLFKAAGERGVYILSEGCSCVVEEAA